MGPVAVLAVETVVLGGAIAIGAVLAVVVFVVASQAEERASARGSLRHLADYEREIETVRETEMLDPFRQRVLGPVQQAVASVGRRLTPTGYADKVRERMTWAGEPSPEKVDRFLVVRLVCLFAAPFAALAAYSYLPVGGMTRLALTGVVVFVLVKGPDSTLDRKIEARQNELRRKLPDVLDLLTISVEAGLGFEQAVDRTVDSVPGPLSDEFARMLGETRAGVSRADALRAMEARCNVPEIRSFVLAILQADAFGVSIGRVLRSQADEMRVRRRQIAEETAQKAPVKMLLPMVFCIFPSLFLVVLGPAMINIADNL